MSREGRGGKSHDRGWWAAGCDPHEVGHGPLRPNELIIVDVFRGCRRRYHGDMTRTFLKGRANPEQRALVRAVRRAQQASLDAIQAGVKGDRVHAAANDVFIELGYVTEQRGSGFVGFIHSTGHGWGSRCMRGRVSR